MSRRHVFTLIAINALLSLLISAGVVWAGLRLGLVASPRQPTPYVIVPPTATFTPVLTPTPVRTATPTNTIATEVYIVQPGDTLLAIALRVGMDLNTLMALNDIGNADRLLVGQELLVPLGSLPAVTVTPALPTASPGLTITVPVTATSPPPTVTLLVSPSIAPLPSATITPSVEVTTSVAGPQPVILEVITPGQLDSEAVVLANRGDAPLLLRHWTLTQAGGRRYVFPAYTLAAGAVVRIHTGSGLDDREDLYWAQAEAAWTEAGPILLLDPAGEIVARIATQILDE